MTLDEIRLAMIKKPPNFDELTGGWASMNNHQSNIGLAGYAPPSSEPVLESADDVLPASLMARFYFWTPAPPGFTSIPNLNPKSARRLAALDVVITQEDANHIGILLSSRNRQQLNRRDGAVASLQSILKASDETIKIDRTASHLTLLDADIFLWLTVKRRDQPQISPDLRLDTVSGISGRDASSRTADLRSGVDFDRPNFLTAVAEADTLGPIDVSFVQNLGSENRSFRANVYIDGGFSIRKSELHFPNIIDGEDLMLKASLLLAYSIIPRINTLYKADGAKWTVRRLEVIESAMNELRVRYAAAQVALQNSQKSVMRPADSSVNAG